VDQYRPTPRKPAVVRVSSTLHRRPAGFDQGLPPRANRDPLREEGQENEPKPTGRSSSQQDHDQQSSQGSEREQEGEYVPRSRKADPRFFLRLRRVSMSLGHGRQGLLRNQTGVIRVLRVIQSHRGQGMQRQIRLEPILRG
jgi:hypothetical protein